MSYRPAPIAPMAAVTSSGSTLAGAGFRGRGSAKPLRVTLHPVLVAVLVFQNLFNAFSPYLTLALNLGVLIALGLKARARLTLAAPPVVVAALCILTWLALVVVMRGDAESQVILKYSRTTAAVVLLAFIFGSYTVPARFVVDAMNVAFGFHILLIGLQLLWPESTNISAGIFGFEREASILEQYAMRKLGASSSYDTASLFSIAGLLFFALQFLQTRRTVFLAAAVVAFLAALMSSRTGMAIALVVVVVFCIRLVSTASIGWKIASLFGAAAISVGVYVVLVPLLLHSLGIAELQADDVTVVFAATDYGRAGTLEALTQDHLEPLKRAASDLLIGFAVDPNTIGRFTDIGYVKFIYHVGIAGTVIIVLLHLYMLAVTYSFSKTALPRSDRRLLAHFLLFFLLIALAFNYKSLELHSRGTGDFIFLLFLCLSRVRRARFATGSSIRSARPNSP